MCSATSIVTWVAHGGSLWDIQDQGFMPLWHEVFVEDDRNRYGTSPSGHDLGTHPCVLITIQGLRAMHGEDLDDACIRAASTHPAARRIADAVTVHLDPIMMGRWLGAMATAPQDHS
jgi:hypothetical protein